MLSSTDSVVVLIVTVDPSTVKFPCTLTPSSVTVISVLPFTVVVTDPSATVMLSLPTVKLVFADSWSSTYFLLATSPSALGAAVAIPVIVPAEADIVISPTSIPFLTLKLRVVMVPYLPHDYC